LDCWRRFRRHISPAIRYDRPGRRRKFRIGALLATLPTLFAVAIAIRETTIGDPHLCWVVYASGLPMLIPVIHPGYATRPGGLPGI